jgi:hypothetical protein
MALKDLFRSKTSKLKPDPRVRWFGKLPTYPDYYSSPADEGWAVEFNDWVLKGFELYRGRAGGRAPRLPVSGCALRLPKSGMTVIACLLDYGGDMRGRPFPMCFYVGVPTWQWPGPTSDRLAGVSRAIRDLLALRREIPRFINSPGRFESFFGEREVDLTGIDKETSDSSWLSASRALALDEWFQDVRGLLKTPDRPTWLELVLACGAGLAARAAEPIEPTLGFPLSMRYPMDAQLAGWVCWLEARLDLSHRSLSLVVAGEPDTGAGQFTCIARELVVDDFLLLTPLVDTLPYVDNLATLGGKDGATVNETAHDGLPSTDSLRTWADFVCCPVHAA